MAGTLSRTSKRLTLLVKLPLQESDQAENGVRIIFHPTIPPAQTKRLKSHIAQYSFGGEREFSFVYINTRCGIFLEPNQCL